MITGIYHQMALFPLYTIMVWHSHIISINEVFGSELNRNLALCTPCWRSFLFYLTQANGIGELKTRIDSIFSSLQQWSNVAIWKSSGRGRKWRKTTCGCHLGFIQNGGRMPNFLQFHLVPFLGPQCPLNIPTAKLRPVCNVYECVWQALDHQILKQFVRT